MGGISKYLGNCVSVGQLRSLKHSYFIICGNEKPGYCSRIRALHWLTRVEKRCYNKIWVIGNCGEKSAYRQDTGGIYDTQIYSGIDADGYTE